MLLMSWNTLLKILTLISHQTEVKLEKTSKIWTLLQQKLTSSLTINPKTSNLRLNVFVEESLNYKNKVKENVWQEKNHKNFTNNNEKNHQTLADNTSISKPKHNISSKQNQEKVPTWKQNWPKIKRWLPKWRQIWAKVENLKAPISNNWNLMLWQTNKNTFPIYKN